MLFLVLTFVFHKISFECFRSVTIILLLLLISFHFIFISARLLKKIQRIEKNGLAYIIVLTFFEPFLYFIGERYGLTFVFPAIVAVIIAIIALLVPVAAYIVFREGVSSMNIVGLFLCFIGILIVIFTADVGWVATVMGVLFMSMAIISEVAFAISIKELTFKHKGSTITAYQNLFGIFLFLHFFSLLSLKKMAT